MNFPFSISICKKSFSDLLIKIENKNSKTKLLNKRDPFPFSIVPISDLESIIPSNTDHLPI